jgi:carbon monoxide dehydrogenase subunit G
MTKVSMSTHIAAPINNVWDLIGGFNAVHDWHPAVEKSDIEGSGKGSVRTLHLLGGGKIEERLEQIDEEGYVYDYSILSSPLPVANYRATLRVEPSEDGQGTTVHWSSEFEPAGASPQDATKVIQDIYQAGFDNLKKMFGM